MCNVVYALLTENMEDLTTFDRDLEMKFDWEMTPEELRREEFRRAAAGMGAISGQAEALGAMKMRTVG
jgi:hypothetical protein